MVYIILILGAFGLLSLYTGDVGEAFELVVSFLRVVMILAGIGMVIGGFGYGIYAAVTTYTSYYTFHPIEYLRTYGKECLISHGLFYGGIIVALIGVNMGDSD